MKNTAAIEELSEPFKIRSGGFPAIMEGPWLFQSGASPEGTVLIFENQQVRHMYAEGPQHPLKEDLWPTRLGDSIGHWEGCTLIVDTIARISEPLAPRAWLSELSDRAHFTERLRMVNREKIVGILTAEDPVAL